MFPEGDLVRDLQTELDGMIDAGVTQIVKLLRNSDTRISNTAADTEDTFIMDQRKKNTYRGMNFYKYLPTAVLLFVVCNLFPYLKYGAAC